MTMKRKNLPQHIVVEVKAHDWIKGALFVLVFLVLAAALERADANQHRYKATITELRQTNAKQLQDAEERAAVPQVRLEGDQPVCTFANVRDQWLHVISQQCEALGNTLKLARTVP
jgi:hypothetical protein